MGGADRHPRRLHRVRAPAPARADRPRRPHGRRRGRRRARRDGPARRRSSAIPPSTSTNVRAAGGIERWLPQWDALYRRELRQAEDGRWVARTSRAACEEDLDDMIARDWKEAWRPLADADAAGPLHAPAPTAASSCPSPSATGCCARAAQPTLAEVDATHSDIMTADATWAAVDEHLSGLSLLEAVVVLAAGVAAGTINTVVGSGTLITFPVLLAVGYPPVTANVSNTIGLVPGSVAGAIGYREELRGQRARALRLGACSRARRRHRRGRAARPARRPVQGDRARLHRGRAGADRPAAAAGQARSASAARAPARGTAARRLRRRASTAATSAPPRASCCSASSALTLPEALQRINALKNVLAGIVNGVAGLDLRLRRRRRLAARRADRRRARPSAACSARATAAGSRPRRCAR